MQKKNDATNERKCTHGSNIKLQSMRKKVKRTNLETVEKSEPKQRKE